MSQLHRILTVLFVTISISLGAVTADQTPTQSVAERRITLLQQAAKGPSAVPVLVSALNDENLVVRRTAVRLLADLGASARPALVKALDNSDFMVRRAALWAVCDPVNAKSLPCLKIALKDQQPLIRLTATNLILLIRPRTEEMNDLLNQARHDESQIVRDVVAQATWPFYKETVSIRERKDYDHDIKTVQTIPLPKEGWRFNTDLRADGHLQKWYEAGFDDSTWSPISIETAWENQGYKYDGIAWYRRGFELPAKPDCLAVELRFDGVDECAWVWINGQYVGQHDIGPDGWDIPFSLDVTKELKWGQKNQITVRVYDSAYAGGIWKPVMLEVLK